jgi:Tat protein secretion system quality control protein TatD with DNase activity
MGWIGCVGSEKFRRDFMDQACALIAPARLVLHRFSGSDETVQNAPKHEFGVQWGGLGAFIARNSDMTSLHELMH